jgi:hypothetical protein
MALAEEMRKRTDSARSAIIANIPAKVRASIADCADKGYDSYSCSLGSLGIDARLEADAFKKVKTELENDGFAVSESNRIVTVSW